MVQTEAAISPLKLIIAEKTFNRARSVDEVTHMAFHGLSKRSRPPKPNYPAKTTSSQTPGYRSNSYSSPYRRQLHLRWSEHIDGRVIAKRFLEYLHENGIHCHVSRPEYLDDPQFTEMELVKTQQILMEVRSRSAREKLNGLRMNVGYLLLYADGRIDIVDRNGILKYLMDGITSRTQSVTISLPIGANGKNQKYLYKGFLRTLR